MPRRSLSRKLFRIAAFVFISFLCVLLLATGYLYLNRDNIGRKVLTYSNSLTHGKLSFEDITFNPFRQFPNISLSLREVEYYENDIVIRNQNEKPVFNIERVHAAINVKDLILGEINVTRIFLKNGDFRLVRYPDSTMNLLNALKPFEEKEKAGAKALKDTSGLVLDLVEISIYGIQIDFDDRVKREHEGLYLKKLMASFGYDQEVIRSKVKTDMNLQLVQFSDKIRIKNKSLQLETAFSFLQQDRLLQIDPSSLSIDEAMMNIGGEIDLNENDKFDLQVDGSDHDFSILQLFLTKKGLKNLKQGDLFFRGSITGVPGSEIPLADFSFGLEDVRLYVPAADDYISELNLSGKFNSGLKEDLSGASLDIDTVLAKLPSGHLNGSFHMADFASPEVDLIWDMETALSGMEQVIKLEFLDSLDGRIGTKCMLLGARNYPDSNHIIADYFTLDILCDDVSFDLPGVMSIELANGNIYTNRDTTWLVNLDVLTDDSDFLINGTIINGLYLPFNIEHEILADLQIESDVFDLPGFLSFIPEIEESFNYRIKDVMLDVSLATSTSKMLAFEVNPKMDFEIRHLDASIEDFLPRVTNMSGIFKLGEKHHRTFLDFKDFEFDILESSLQADLELGSPEKGETYLNMVIQTENLNPGEVLWGETPDSIPDFVNGVLNSSFMIDLYFDGDKNTRIKNLNLGNADLHYINPTDTFEISSLDFFARDVRWDTDKESIIMASLNAAIDMRMKRLVTDYFAVDDLEHLITITDGVFELTTDQARLFAKAGKGDYVLAPFAEVPYYKLKFDVKGFEINEFLETFLSDTVISGTMDLYMDVSVEGKTIDEIRSSVNGELILFGEDLLLYGIDLDEVIKKFKRSQNFNLVDLGAVMFAGPAGLALTKGSDYATMLVTNYGESSAVREIVSDWVIEKGTIHLRDVAFSTDESRVAAKGWLDFQKDSLDIAFAVIDKRGCSIIGQDLSGTIKDSEKSKIKLISTLLAPVTNLLELALGIDCEPFYEGRIKHPE